MERMCSGVVEITTDAERSSAERREGGIPNVYR